MDDTRFSNFRNRSLKDKFNVNYEDLILQKYSLRVYNHKDTGYKYIFNLSIDDEGIDNNTPYSAFMESWETHNKYNLLKETFGEDLDELALLFIGTPNEEYYKKEGELTFCYMYNILEHTWNKIFVNKEDKDDEDENEIIK